MARDDVFLVRHSSIPAVAESNGERGVVNRMGFQVVVDFFTQMLLSGYCFHMQTGTEDAPVTTNGPLDDTIAAMVADCGGGAMMPLLYEVNVSAHATSTLVQAMLEADMDKARYTSGGTVYVPEQLNKAAAAADAANGTFYTIEGSDIVVAAKSAVPASVELARKVFSEDAIADPAGHMGSWNTVIFSARERIPVVLTNPGSLVCQFGSATADVTGYASMDFAQFPAGLAY